MIRKILLGALITGAIAISGLMGCNDPASPEKKPPSTAPTLTGPSNGASDVAPSPTFSWSTVNGANAYIIQVSTDSNFSSGIIINDSSVTSTSLTSSTQLSAGVVYYWRVYSKNNDGRGPVSNVGKITIKSSDTPEIPSGVTPIYIDGFGGDLSKWYKDYMVNTNDFYPHMRITSEAAHQGKYSLTTDSNRTALVYWLASEDRIETGICGVQFYIMAKTAGGINFTVQIGQNAGSSGGLGKEFGIGFDVRDSIKATFFDYYGGRIDKMVEPINPGHWYKCQIEVDFTTKPGKTLYKIDDKVVDEGTLPTKEMFGIDRLLVFRGEAAGPDYSIPCNPGPKQYYVDDIVFYSK